MTYRFPESDPESIILMNKHYREKLDYQQLDPEKQDIQHMHQSIYYREKSPEPINETNEVTTQNLVLHLTDSSDEPDKKRDTWKCYLAAKIEDDEEKALKLFLLPDRAKCIRHAFLRMHYDPDEYLILRIIEKKHFTISSKYHLDIIWRRITRPSGKPGVLTYDGTAFKNYRDLSPEDAEF